MTIVEQELIETQAPADPLQEEVSRILEDAAEKIEQRGWYNGDEQYWGITVCPGLAINELAAIRDPHHSRSLCFLAHLRLRNHLGLQPNSSIPIWNDQQTDARVVIRALREAAAA